MATLEEKQELVDALSGPRYYRIRLAGYGGESSYMSITQEAHDFWKDHVEQYGDNDLANYMLNAEDGDFDFEELETVPTEAEFMTDKDGDARPWYEPPNEIEHTYGVNYESSRIFVEEVTGSDYNSDHVQDVIDGQDVTELNCALGEEYGIDIVEMDCCNEAEAEYIAQMYSSEKGCFFDGIVETTGDFDPKKLKIYTTEYLNGEDTITHMCYNSVDIENIGGDTNGKGYYASVWSNE